MKRIIVGVLIVLGMFVASPVAFAQQVRQLSQVNIQGASVTDQVGRSVAFSFTMTNGAGAHPEVMYGIRLLNKDRVVVDETVFPEVFALAEQGTLKKSAVYVPPAVLSGTYTMQLVVSEKSGLTLGLMTLKDVTFSAEEKGLVIVPGSCTVSGAEQKKSLQLSSTVLLRENEAPVLTCVVTNTASGPIAGTPSFKTFSGNIYGASVEAIGGTTTPFLVKPAEKKTIAVTLPVPKDAGLYKTVVQLVNGQSVSNSVVAGYSVFGSFASIKSILADKDYYAKGEQAVIAFALTSAGAVFKDAAVVIKTSGGLTCGKAVVSSPKNGVQTATVQVKHNCFNPVVSVAVTNAAGATVAQDETSIATTSTKNPSVFSGGQGAVLLVLILVVIALIGLYIKKRRASPQIIAGFVIFLALSVLPTAEVQAAQFYAGANNELYVTISLSNFTHPGQPFSQGDEIQVDGYIENLSALDQTVTFSWIDLPTGNTANLFPGVVSIPAYSPYFAPASQYFTVNVPTTPPLPQTFYVSFTVEVDDSVNSGVHEFNATNNSLATILEDAAVDGVSLVPSNNPFPLGPGGGTAGPLNFFGVSDVYIRWSLGSSMPGGHTNLYDTYGNRMSTCAVQQRGDPDPTFTWSNVDMSGALPLSIEIVDGEYCE